AVGAALQPVGSVDPGGGAVRKGGPVVGSAPDQQAALAVPGGRALLGVAVCRVEALVLEAGTDDVRDLRRQRREPEPEAARRLRVGAERQQAGKPERDEEAPGRGGQ